MTGYLDIRDYNFLVMEWQLTAQDVESVIPNTRIAGRQAGYTVFFLFHLHIFIFIWSFRAFIDFLIDITGVPLSAFHVFGHSAGAHVAGSVGLGFKERHNSAKLIPRVTGLDPAAYILDLNDIDDRIDPTDGEYVDIIHTDDGVAGITIPMGHAGNSII